MALHTDARSLLRAQGKRFAKVRERMIAEHESMTKDMVIDARDLVSGGIKTPILKALGHPFGRRASGRKRGKLPLLPINVQSGRLRASLRRTKVSSGGNSRAYDVKFDAPYAKYVLAVGGTTRMVGRGFWRELKKRWKKRNFDLLMRIRALQRGS